MSYLKFLGFTSVIPTIVGLWFLIKSLSSDTLFVKQSAFVYVQLIVSNLCNERLTKSNLCDELLTNLCSFLFTICTLSCKSLTFLLSFSLCTCSRGGLYKCERIGHPRNVRTKKEKE
jgi:hypothetical protein